MKNHYLRPKTKVIKVQQMTHLLQGSEQETKANRSGYGDANIDYWE